MLKGEIKFIISVQKKGRGRRRERGESEKKCLTDTTDGREERGEREGLEERKIY